MRDIIGYVLWLCSLLIGPLAVAGYCLLRARAGTVIATLVCTVLLGLYWFWEWSLKPKGRDGGWFW